MRELWNLLEQLDVFTRTLGTMMVSDRWRLLSRTEQKRVTEKLREAYLRMGNVLEEWDAARSQDERG